MLVPLPTREAHRIEILLDKGIQEHTYRNVFHEGETDYSRSGQNGQNLTYLRHLGKQGKMAR